MDTTQALRQAISLMDTHGLLDSGWSFKFDNAKTRFGLCVHTTKTISISRPLTELNSEAEVADTILHEIAHALVGPDVGHGAEWVRIARSIGCNGERESPDGTVTPTPPYRATCGTCGTHWDRHRRSRYSMACPRCCREHNGGRYTVRFALFFVDTRSK